MPVLVTAADTPLGTLVVHSLLALGGEVRAWCTGTGPVAPLRSAGAIVAAGDLDDTGRLEAACEQVHTVVHLGGGVLSPSADRIVADTASVAEAATGAGVRRLLLLSAVGARPDAPDAFRRAKAVAEDVVADAAPPSLALRVPLVATPGLRGVLAGTPLPPEVRQAEVRTILPGDVARLVVALDEMRSELDRGHAALVAQGGEPVAIEDWLGEVEVQTYLPADRAPLLAEALVAGWTDVDPVAADAWSFTGVTAG